MKEPVTVGLAARILQVSEQTVRNFERDGKLRAIRVGQLRLFARRLVERLAAQRKVKP